MGYLCNVGVCNETTNTCTTQPATNNTPCDDGLFCTTGNTCQIGACNAGVARSCTHLNDGCNEGQCNESTDQCVANQIVFPCLSVTITGAPDARTWSPDAIFEFECSDPVCNFECRIDGGPWTTCSSPREYTGLALGEHTFEVRARKGTGAWSDPDTHTWEVYLPSCADAVAHRLYIGCEYWPFVMPNPVEDPFKAHFAVVVTNPLPGTVANISVYNGSNVLVATAQVPGNQLRVIRLPWDEIPYFNCTGSPGNPTCVLSSLKQKKAFRLVSDVPVNAYQFSPLVSHIPSGCKKNQDCPLWQTRGETCDVARGVCNLTDYSFSNDASMLLPTHIFGAASQYIVPALPHVIMNGSHQPSVVAIVGTQDGTQVRIRSRGHTVAGPAGGVTALAPGGETTVTLNRHEVLQLISRPMGATRSLAAVPAGNGTSVEYYESDFTGSLVDSDKPVAVFSGARCRFVPFNYYACDHLEQQVFPLETLGHSYVGAVAIPPLGSDPTTAPVSGDVWRLVAVQDGTQITITPSSVQASVVLNAGQWIEFIAKDHFHVTSQGADYPILLTQYLVGQLAHGGVYGDPSMILPVPVPQYRQQYMFTTTQDIATHYVNIVRTMDTFVSLNGTPVTPACWEAIPGTPFEVCRTQVSEGVHTLSAGSGVGLIVYGYDRFVSYGYTGGLGLLPTTAVNPDW
ncbi:MAG: IgGFc-binding protein [Bradymonadaceae bacterium]|nr:IgGFc-binding protein [Lujinxingiaceae bacterium]